jgi:hypothetical protein
MAFAGFLGIGMAALCPPSAAASAGADARLRLAWDAPTGCPGRAEIMSEVSRLLGTTSGGIPGELAATARVHRVAPRRWVVRLSTSLDGTRGQRQLEGDSCQAVASATALILALTLDPAVDAEGRPPSGTTPAPAAPPPETNPRPPSRQPSSKLQSSQPPPAPAHAPPPSPPPSDLTVPEAPPASAAPSEPAPVPPTPFSSPSTGDPTVAPPEPTATSTTESAVISASAPPPRPRLQYSVRPFVGIATATLPAAAGIAGAGVGLHWSIFEVAISAWGSQERRELVAERPAAGGDFRLFGAAARACGQLAQGWVRLGLCGGAALERVTAEGFGVESPGDGAALVGAGLVAGTLTVPLGGRVDASLEIAGLARPYHPRFVLRGVGPVFSLPAVSALATLGVIVKL